MMKTSHDICPICGEGHLQHLTSKNCVDYKGHSTELDMQYSVCDACGSEQADSVQLRANKRAMMAFRKRVDGLLTGVEVRALRERLGIKQAEAACIFGGGPVAFSKYESDDVAQSEAMDKLLRLAAAVPDAFAHLAHVAGVRLDETDQWTTSGKMERIQQQRPALHVISKSRPASEDGWRKTGT
jgi:HTH-type transcriptional regulator/antitoxin MqsA